MKGKETDRQMRALEYFRGVRLLPGVWPVIRLDGRSFGSFVGDRFERPYDERFRDLIVATSRAVLDELQGLYAYTMSDEISLLLPREWEMFDRRMEKAVSVSAGIASAAFTHAAGEPAHFDSRIWLGADTGLVAEYFTWRQGEAARNALHSWCYWTLRKEGKNAREASSALRGKGAAFQNELLFCRGINFNDLPPWQRRGVGLYRERYEKPGHDPVKDAVTVAVRRRTRVAMDLPVKDEYAQFLHRIMAGSAAMAEAGPI